MNNRARRAVNDADAAINVLQRFRRVMPELDRRCRFPAGNDGFKSSSLGGGGGASGEVGRPTERAALAGKQQDPVREHTRESLRILAKMNVLAVQMNNLLTLADADTVGCTECKRTDVPRLVGGRCDACRMRSNRSKAKEA